MYRKLLSPKTSNFITPPSIIYKPPISTTPISLVRPFHSSPTTTNKIFSSPKIPNKYTYSHLDRNRYFRILPPSIKQRITKFIEQPYSNGLSFVILHELSAIVPFLSFWYLFYHYPSLIPVEVPEWALEKATKLMQDNYPDLKFENPQDKAHMIMGGGLSYIVVKMMFPLRIIFSFWAMNWFAKWFINPLVKVYQMIVNKGKPLHKGDIPLLVPKEKLKELKKPRL